MKHCGFTQLSISFSSFLSQDVTAVRLFTLESAGTGALKALGGTAIGFDFRHLFAPNKNKQKSLRFRTRLGKMRRPCRMVATS
jgi:hypothetical protein